MVVKSVWAGTNEEGIHPLVKQIKFEISAKINDQTESDFLIAYYEVHRDYLHTIYSDVN